jgi:dihydroorotase-like cyclic amidohydrolase
MTQIFDLILRGGTVVTPGGEARTDIGIIGERIVRIGDLSQASAGEIYGASGLHILPGVQTMVPIMLTHVNDGKLSLQRFVELTSAGPQRVFGLAYKGRIAEGYHADFTVVDLKRRETITNDWSKSKCGWTPFDGFEATGWPVATIVRGGFVMRDGEITRKGAGQPVRFNETLEPLG